MAGLLETTQPAPAKTAGLLGAPSKAPGLLSASPAETSPSPVGQMPVSLYDEEKQAEERKAILPVSTRTSASTPQILDESQPDIFKGLEEEPLPISVAHGLTRSIASTELGAVQAAEGKGKGGKTPVTDTLGAYPSDQHPAAQAVHRFLFGGTSPIPSLSDIAAGRESSLKPSLGNLATPVAILGTAGEAATNFLFPEDDAAMKAFSEAASKTGSENAIADLARTHLKGITDAGAEILAKRYAPLMDNPKAILTDLKAVSAKANGLSKIGEAPKPEVTKPSLEELQTRHDILKDTLSDHPAKGLAQRFNLTQSHLGGDLGDIQARASARAADIKPGSAAAAKEIANPTYARQLDSHVKEMGFDDLEHAQKSIDEYNAMRGQLRDTQDQIRETKSAAIPKTPEAAASKYWDNAIAPKIAKNEPIVLSGDDMKMHFGNDFDPERSDFYAKANYLNVQRAIEEHPGDFAMLGGGPGAGKTELLTKDILGRGYKGILYDTTLSNYAGVTRLIDEARAAGKNIHIFGIVPDLEKARNFTFARAAETGREVSDAAFARGHAGFIDTLKRLLEDKVITPDELDLFDTRNITSLDEAKKLVKVGVSARNPLALLKKAGYSEEDILAKKYERQGTNTGRNLEGNAREPGIPGEHGGAPGEDRANSGSKVGQMDSRGKTGLGEKGGKKQIVDRVPLPPQIGNVISRTGEEIKAPEHFDHAITDHNGGVTPPVSRGGLQPPEIDFTKAKDISAARQSTDTMDRTLEKIFDRNTATEIKNFLTKPTVENETARAAETTMIRKTIRKDVVKGLGIKPKSVESALLQQFGEGRMSLDDLQKASPENWEKIVEAVPKFRQVYDDLLDRWNHARFEAGMKPIPKLDNYFRHFLDIQDWMKSFGFDFSNGKLPTAISGLTHNFRSQTPWASASMRRFGSTFTDDAVTGLDNYIDNTLRAIYHTDSVQRGRILEKYLRQAGRANPEIKLGNLAANMNNWTNLVSGKQALFDRATETMLGRNGLTVMRAIGRRFGMNEINANLSAAMTHTLPIAYLPGTTDLGSIFRGALDTVLAPLQEDFMKIDGVPSGFLTRRFRESRIADTATQKVAEALGSPFTLASEFMTRLVVSSKYYEGIAHGLPKTEAMARADDYGVRVIGDRSVGSLPTVMNTKTLNFLTQFQIEVNNSLKHVLHDIPYWNEGDKIKIAGTFAKLAVSLYLYNHLMNAIKGSGKGLDPIDLALTVAGAQAPYALTDESDKALKDRLIAAGTELGSELPFSSVVTAAVGAGGQIPAAAALTKPFQDLSSGDWKSAAIDAAVPFASPVGGGIQAQKTFKGLVDWQRGYATNSKGVPTARIPQNVPDFIKGAAFGPSAFPEVKKTNTEIDSLYNAEQMQKMKAEDANTTARNIWSDLSGMDPEKAKQELAQLASENPDMAKRVLKAAQNDEQNITKQDKMLGTLGIANGARAQFIVDHMDGMSDDEKKQYLGDLAAKKLLTKDVLVQVGALMNQ
jgi:hypothetical protein